MTKKLLYMLVFIFISPLSHGANVYFGYGESTAASKPNIKNIGLGYEFKNSFSIFNIENIQPVIEVNYWRWENYDGDIAGGSISPGLKFPIQLPYDPYIKLSIGVAYIERVKWYARQLGDNWLFEDKLEFGVNINAYNTIALNLVHYSNAGLNKNNSGANILSLVYKLNW